MPSRCRMIVLVMLSLLIRVNAGSTLSEYLTQDAQAPGTCVDYCYSWQTCCADGRCVSVFTGCDATCEVDSSKCSYGQICCYVDDEWSCKDSESECIGALWGIGIAAAVALIVVPIVCCCCCGGCALYWLMKRSRERRAQAQRQGAYMMQPGVHMMQPQQPGMQMMQGAQVQPQGYPTGGFVASPPSYEQGNQAG